MLCEIEVTTTGATTRWLLPLGILWEEESSTALSSRLALARVRRGRRTGLLTDAFALSDFARQAIAAMAAGTEVRSGDGVIHFRATENGRAKLANVSAANVHWLAAEQSNSSLTRRLQALEKRFNAVGARASTNDRDMVGDLSDVIASALSSGANRFRHGAGTVRDQSASVGEDAARLGTMALIGS